MGLFVEAVDVWAAPIPDRPGGLAEVLRVLHDAGAEPRCVIARRSPNHPGNGVVFVTPVEGDGEIAAAAQCGFAVSTNVHSVLVMGHDRPGVAADLTQRAAEGGINLRGFSNVVVGTQFVAYLAVDSRAEADRLIRLFAGAQRAAP